ncbi:MAG: DUF4258 domain-containing protein [Anaerolineae bacterium]|nr:DUF4258 domain-containing protein [Anaerolineae bacterium]
MSLKDQGGILERVREAAAKRILYLPHALHQMHAPDRMISPEEVRAVVFYGEVIEDYPGDVRGHSCLMLGWGHQGRPIHIVCAPKADYLAIITAYLPGEEHWESDRRTRKR